MDIIHIYETEISTKEIFSLMKKNIYNSSNDKNTFNIDKKYTLQRRTMISLIQKISKKMNFKSQTFFLCIHYLDIIFFEQKEISYNYNLLAAGCLITAAKFCENVFLKPTFQHFIDICNEEINVATNQITKEDLFLYEIIICKILNYKLNYYTAYDFNFFFYGNGILKKEHLKDINNSTELSESKIRVILIKIYETMRLYLYSIIRNIISLKYNSLILSIYIMEKSIDYVLLKEFNREDSFNTTEIKTKNKKYFWRLMKDLYNIEFKSLQEYQYLQIDCENYKIFDEYNIINSKIDLNNSYDFIYSTKLNDKLNTNRNSSKSKNKNKAITKLNYQSPKSKKFNKNNAKLLYKKVNITILENKNNNDKNEIKEDIMRKLSPNIKKVNQNEINLTNNYNNNTNTKRTIYNFYQNNKKTKINSVSHNKDYYYLKKTNTSSSQFKNLFNKNNKLNKNNIIKIINSPDDTNTNSFDEKKDINEIIIKNKNINLSKPYRKKIVQNHEKNQLSKNNNNNNININININNRILYEEISKSKYRNKSTKKIIISKYEDNYNSSNVKGRNLKYKSRAKLDENYKKINLDSSPIYKRNISKSKYNISFQNNKNNDKSFNKINLNSFYFKENESNKLLKSKNVKELNNIKTENIINSSLTSRNSFHFPKHDIKLTDSFLNIKMNYFNNEINDKNISTFINDNDKVLKKKYLNNYDSFNYNDNRSNFENYNSKIVNNNYYKGQNNISNNFNFNFNYVN